jgi:hypothetical protein
MVLLCIFWFYSLDRYCSSLATCVCLMVLLAAHFSKWSASHCLRNYYDFLIFSLSCSLNLDCSNSFACLAFSSYWEAFSLLLCSKSTNFLSSPCSMISFCAGWSSLSCLTKCSLVTWSNLSLLICIFLRGVRVLLRRLVLVKALSFVFSSC